MGLSRFIGRAMPVLALIALLGISGCAARTPPTQVPSDTPPTAEATTPTATLEKYFDASTKTGSGPVTRVSDQTAFNFDSEFWIDGRKFRYDLHQDGKLVRSIMSPDGVTAYFVEHAEKTSEPSVASVDRYLLEFAKPAGASVEDGTDPETGATRLLYKVNKLDDLAGADNAWMSEDVTYLVKDGNVVGVITRGYAPDKDGKPGTRSVSRRMFDSVSVGEPIDPGTFQLPYPVKPAQ